MDRSSSGSSCPILQCKKEHIIITIIINIIVTIISIVTIIIIRAVWGFGDVGFSGSRRLAGGGNAASRGTAKG